MSFAHEALDVVLGRLSICSIARLCSTSSSIGYLCLQLLSKQPARIQKLLLDEVQKAATLKLQSLSGNISRRRQSSITRKLHKCARAVQWLLRAKLDDSLVAPSNLTACNPEFKQQLLRIPNVPEAMAHVIVREAGVCISQQELMAAVASGVEGVEVWVSGMRACGCQSDLPAWTEVICCDDSAYVDALPVPPRTDITVELLQLAINCKSSIALKLLGKLTTEDWRQQVPRYLLQQLALTSIIRGHEPAVLVRLLLMHPFNAATIAEGVRVELQRLSSNNCVFSSRGDLRRLQYLPVLLEQEAANDLEPALVGEVALATARLTDWPILMLDYLCRLPAMQQLTDSVVGTLLRTVVQRCKSPRCDLLLELEVLHALCRLECASQLQQHVIVDLLMEASDGAHAAVAAVLCHYLDPRRQLHSSMQV